MGKLRYTIADLLKQPGKNVFDISQVDVAILETNGQLSVLLKPGTICYPEGPATRRAE